MRKFLKDWSFPLLILVISSFVAFKNYTPGTWMLGWDDLVPELNFGLNIGRSLSSVWQEYQGVGLLGGMAHGADLSRQVVLWLFSFIFPTSFLRFFWTFLMLSIGPIGIYFMVGKAVLSKQSGFVSGLAGFAASIFYLFNLATVQTFYTPFETFVAFYGFVPWLLYFAIDYLKTGKKKFLLFFCLFSLLGSSAFYVQTLFVVFVTFLVVLCIEAVFKFGKDGFERSFKLGLVTFCLNAFWLLPVLFFSLTSAFIPASSHINSIATPETQFMNLARSDFGDIATLKGYWFDYYDWDNFGNYDFLYKNWIGYSSQPLVVNTSLALFAVSLLGLILSLFKKKTGFGLSFLVLFVISYFMLSGGKVSFFPFFSEIFRNAFTKWSNAMALIYAVGIGFFVFVISDLFKSKVVKYVLGVILLLEVMVGSLFSVWPVFEGNLISKSMRVELPSYYLETVDYFKTLDQDKRVADFPLTDFWGWKFNTWGYRGSGFIWYGIGQPILDRAFDVWSPNNEAFYDEINHAVVTQNIEEFDYVLRKYQVGYILFDGSVFEPGKDDSTQRIEKQKRFLESSPLISRLKKIGEIVVYEVGVESGESFITAPKENLESNFFVAGSVGEPVITESFSDAQGYLTAKNCNLKELGNVEKKKISFGNYYSAENDGISCDYFYYPDIDYSQAYSLRIRGENTLGRSLKFYLYNVGSKNIDREELLPVGKFDESYLILPTESSPSSGIGYTLSVETRSYGKIKSENTVTGIEFRPVEYEISKGESITNNLDIIEVKKYGTWGYKTDVQGYGLLQLSQGYEDGWVAFAKVDGVWKKLEHTKVNSWSNGWFIPVNSQSFITPIYIFFWPQVLEWGGMVLGLFSFVILFFRSR